MGGGNRDCWDHGSSFYKDKKGVCTCPACRADKIESAQNCVERTDDDCDNTYCTFKFQVPEKWKSDFEKILEGKIEGLSVTYKKKIYDTFPKIKDKLEKILEGNDNE